MHLCVCIFVCVGMQVSAYAYFYVCAPVCVCLRVCVREEGGRGVVGGREGFACMQVLPFLKTFLYHQGPRGCGIIDVFSRYFPNGAAEMPGVNHLF